MARPGQEAGAGLAGRHQTMVGGGAAHTVAGNGAVVALVHENTVGAMEAATVVGSGGAVAAGPAHEALPSCRYVRPGC